MKKLIEKYGGMVLFQFVMSIIYDMFMYWMRGYLPWSDYVWNFIAFFIGGIVAEIIRSRAKAWREKRKEQKRGTRD
jgi:hypothetical protein